MGDDWVNQDWGDLSEASATSTSTTNHCCLSHCLHLFPNVSPVPRQSVPVSPTPPWQAVVNENPTDRIIRQLKEEVAALRQQLGASAVCAARSEGRGGSFLAGRFRWRFWRLGSGVAGDQKQTVSPNAAAAMLQSKNKIKVWTKTCGKMIRWEHGHPQR